MFRRISIALAVTVMIVLFAVSPALADSVTYSGDTTGGPTFNRTFASCSGLSGTGTAVAYRTQPFFVSADGLYTFSSIQNGFDGYLFLYTYPFNSGDAQVNCLSGDDDGSGGIGTSDFNYTLTAGTIYVLVTTGFGNGDYGPFENKIEGPGTITLGTQAAAPDVPGEDMVYIPPEAVVGMFLADTPVYYAPQADAVTTIVMEAGKTVWVYGVDSSGQYYQAMIAGHFFWVPVSTMGPNPDTVWNNTPLPQVVIDTGTAMDSSSK